MPEKKCSLTRYRVYPSTGLASAAAQRISKRPPKTEPVVWKCLFCGGWHYRFKPKEVK